MNEARECARIDGAECKWHKEGGECILTVEDCHFTPQRPHEFEVLHAGRSPIERAFASQRQEGGTHYKDMGVEPWDVVDSWPLEQRIGYYRGGALKYLMRMGAKDASAQEIAKGKHYMEKLLEVLQEGAT